MYLWQTTSCIYVNKAMHCGIPSNQINRFWCESNIRANIPIYFANIRIASSGNAFYEWILLSLKDMLIFSDCNTLPELFLPHGVAEGDQVHTMTTFGWDIVAPTAPLRIFGDVRTGFKIVPGSWVGISTNNYYSTMFIQQRLDYKPKTICQTHNQ